MARDTTRKVTRQEQYRVRHFGGSCNASECGGLSGALKGRLHIESGRLRTIGHAFEKRIGGDRTGTHRVDSYTPVPHILGDRAYETYNCVFARYVGRNVRISSPAVERGHGDDGSSAFAHHSNCLSDRQHYAARIDGEDVLPRFEIDLSGARPRRNDACVRHDNVDSFEDLDYFVEGRMKRVGVADVSLKDVPRIWWSLPRTRFPINNRTSCAIFGEAANNGGSKSIGTACHNGNLPFEKSREFAHFDPSRLACDDVMTVFTWALPILLRILYDVARINSYLFAMRSYVRMTSKSIDAAHFNDLVVGAKVDTVNHRIILTHFVKDSTMDSVTQRCEWDRI